MRTNGRKPKIGFEACFSAAAANKPEKRAEILAIRVTNIASKSRA